MHIVPSNLFRRSERGDTIVEVLICIAIISLVLGGAYVTTTRSLGGTRDAEERGNAMKLIESQVEQVKNLVETNPIKIFGSSVPATYCVSSGNTVISTNAACKVNASGTATTVQPFYNLAITRTGNTFTVTSSWSSTRGKPSTAKLIYRVYQ